ncbi:MAG: putative porin [Chloroflexi bacterium]|nr:putative porin [Chloroflexota bacterium]
MKQLNLWAGEYILLEQSLADEALASVVQASALLALSPKLSANLAVGHYYYNDPTPDGASTVFKANAGNATVDRNGDGTPDDFASDFGILNPIVALTYNGWKLPATVSAEYLLNTRARGSRDTGCAAGLAVGKAEKKGDWRLYYQWQVVEQDAVFTPFAQDDFLFASNHRSHVFGANYQLADNVGLHLWGLVSARDETSPGATTDSDQNQWRARLDLNIKF